ncbi:MAG: hypothetical protein RLZZ316_2258 [Bacteroidota bacterium]|jgi:hypothetical protein
MKNVLLIVTVLFIGLTACSQGAPKSPKVTLENSAVKVVYGQPSKRDRVVFGGLVPYGQVWRAGANNATEITFTKDGSFGGQAIKAGTYSLFVNPTEKDWTIILNSELKQWGSFGYDKIKDKDVLKVTVPVKKLGAVVEALTYRFDGNKLIIEWEQTQAEVTLSF